MVYSCAVERDGQQPHVITELLKCEWSTLRSDLKIKDRALKNLC